MAREVVITGLGTICGLGVGIQPLWDGLIAGRSCLGPVTRLDTTGFRSRLGGEVPADFAVRDMVPKHYRKAVKVMARDTELAVAAAKLAVEDAGLITRASSDAAEGAPAPKSTYLSARMGCQIGAGLIAAEADEMSMAMSTARDESGDFNLRKWGGEGGQGMEALTPLWLLKYLPNMLACHVTILHGAEGPSNTITCAESSGLLSLGESARVIRRGAADLCFSGGAESKLNVMGLLRMDFAGRLAWTGDGTDGTKFVRPFDERSWGGGADSDSPGRGGLIAEGGGILILESKETAQARGAKTYAKIAGFGAAHSDTWYGQAGPADGPNGRGRAGAASAPEADEGYEFAIRNALDDARIQPEAIDAIVPMACGISHMDRTEAAALTRVFGDRLARIPLVTIAPNLGNCFAGNGGLQAAIAAKCLHEKRLPARVHTGSPRKGIDAGPRGPVEMSNLHCILVCSGSLGGQNAAMVLTSA